MNLKRTLLTAAALVALPLTAMAQTTSSSFEVVVNFAPNTGATTTVYISCNGGVPLEQQKSGLGDEDTVTFIVAETDANTDCEIWADEVAGYSVDGGNDPACSYENVGEGFSTPFEQPCSIDFTAEDVTFTVTKDWDLSGEGGNLLDPEYEIRIICTNEINDTNGADRVEQLDKKTWQATWELDGTSDGTYSVDVDATRVGQQCRAEESVFESAVETENGCEGLITIPFGGSASCTITNTVFYEGIPTLSQYGLAVMALLMLGVGFIGFRRFA